MRTIEIGEIRVKANPRGRWVRISAYGHAVIVDKKTGELKALIAALEAALKEAEEKDGNKVCNPSRND